MSTNEETMPTDAISSFAERLSAQIPQAKSEPPSPEDGKRVPEALKMLAVAMQLGEKAGVKLDDELDGLLEVLGESKKDDLPPPPPRKPIDFDEMLRESLKKQKEEEKRYGFFPTPPDLARRVVELAEVEPGMTALEPSAGEGAIARELEAVTPYVDCYELHSERREKLKQEGFTVVGEDFMEAEPQEVYDRIVMNPPYFKKQDVEHVGRALNFLVPGGRIVAIMSAGVKFREDKKTKHLRELITLYGSMEDLPSGSFKESGTNVNTVLVTINKPTS